MANFYYQFGFTCFKDYIEDFVSWDTVEWCQKSALQPKTKEKFTLMWKIGKRWKYKISIFVVLGLQCILLECRFCGMCV